MMHSFKRNKDGRALSTLLVVSATSFLGTFLVSAVNIALPSIENEPLPQCH